MADHYRMLGVARDAPRATIKKAYLEAAKALHPDKYHGSRNERAATIAFEKLQEAYKVLYDPEKRRAYDSTIGEVAAPFRPFDGTEPPRAKGSGPRGPSGLPVQPPSAWRPDQLWQQLRWRQTVKKYRQFSKARPVSMAKPVLGILGLFVAFRVLPMGVMMMCGSDDSTGALTLDASSDAKAGHVGAASSSTSSAQRATH
eukprot:gnl/TRDRNA2_/TRDRNA2_42712_c0_seq1.p1 gnl/TRDRNA2_/TRDRNA2_42712_c0~~gnl/TRDRNA2_/TRDRNA2_42712_c0_seq1.p1  ORF type:complete len:227 (-),score=32.78 gnl/TRDRNA2_/TRDRNA2_42712_c0_seq1:35-634(-)